MAIKFNPFVPNSFVSPAMFVGRKSEIEAIERCLFQTKNGRPHNFVILGERGIGKTSLLYYVNHIAGKGEAGLLGYPFRFVTILTDVGSCTSQIEIVKKIARDLRNTLSSTQLLRDRASSFWDWLSKWEVLGVKFNRTESDLDPVEAAEIFVAKLAEFCNGLTERDGVLLLIDEADRPGVDAHLGEFLKLTSERLGRAGCDKFMFALAGLPVLLERLRLSHESSPRLFETMLLTPLSYPDRDAAIEIGLKEANAKNTTPVTISADAKDLLAGLSEGYPHFLQQFAYSAFASDSDNTISKEDVFDGAFGDGGALSQLGDKFFNEMYHARISSAEYRKVLNAMAEHGDDWVSRQTILAEADVSHANVGNALIALTQRGVILKDETRRGFYRLPTRSFAVWIRAIRRAETRKTVDF